MSIIQSARVQRLDQLRAEIRRLTPVVRDDVRRVGFCVEPLDRRLAGGGLAANGLHEIVGASASIADDAAATLFTAGIATRAVDDGTVLWIVAKADLFAPGLSQAGLPPSRLIQVEARRDDDALAIMEEGLRHGGLGAVVCEVTRIEMTATRRLQLAAEEGRTMALILRRWRKAAVDPLIELSAAVTRWRIGCAASSPLPVAGVGRPRWNVALVRQRNGEPWEWLLEGCDGAGRLALPAELANGSPAAADRPAQRAA